MMIRINSMRFQNIVNNYIEILSDLEEDCCLYDTLKEKMTSFISKYLILLEIT